MKNVSAFVIAAIVTGAIYLPPAVCQNPPRAHSTRSVVVAHGGSYLGVGAIDIDEERAKALNLKEVRGVEIKSVAEDSPAAKAGLKEGDVVLEFGGQQVEGSEQFARLVRETPAGRQVPLVIWRNGATQNITATIGTRSGPYYVSPDGGNYPVTIPPMPPMPVMPPMDLPQVDVNWRNSTIGVEVESLTPQLAEFFGVKEGALVRAVGKNSPAEKAGIKAGDVIVKVDDTKVTNGRGVAGIIRNLHAKRTFPVTVVRKQQEMTVTVTLEEPRGWRAAPVGIATV